MPDWIAKSHVRLRRWLRVEHRRSPQRTDDGGAAALWREHNARALAEGCRCGKPATHARSVIGTLGSIPAKVYSCAEHVNVTCWMRVGGGPWVPSGNDIAGTSEWVGAPVALEARPTPPPLDEHGVAPH